MVEVSVVIPIYHCSECIAPLYQRLVPVLDAACKDFEIVFVDDGGSDADWNKLSEISSLDSRVKVYRHKRNLGQHAAIATGLSKSVGKWMVVIDGDLQDPPEMIPVFLERARAGFDIVWGKRLGRVLSRLRLAISKMFYSFLSSDALELVTGGFGSFSVLSKQAAKSFFRPKVAESSIVPYLLNPSFRKLLSTMSNRSVFREKAPIIYASSLALVFTSFSYKPPSYLRSL